MTAPPKPMTLDEFVAWEDRQDLRYEFDGFVARAMTGGTWAHGLIQANLVRALGNALRGGPCRAVGGEVKVRTETSVRYPDALVTCSHGDPRSTFAPDPVVLFEILSRSTARSDLGAKNAEYQTLPSLRRYVVLRQSVAAADVFLRDDDGEWTHDFLSGEATLAMPEIGAAIPLAEIYEGVEFAE